MSDTLRKRGREPEALSNSIAVRESKRFNGEETDLFPHIPLLDEILAGEEGECASREDFVSGVMKSPEEEISTACSTFYTPISDDNSSAVDISSGHEVQVLFSDSDIDMCCLLEASDGELGIPSSLVVDSGLCQSPKETVTAGGLFENSNLKCEGDIWDFEDEFQNNQQFSLFGNAWNASQVQDYMNRQFVSQDMCLDEDFCGTWTLETADYKQFLSLNRLAKFTAGFPELKKF